MKLPLNKHIFLLLLTLSFLNGCKKKEDPKIRKEAIFYYNRLDDCPYIFRIDSLDYAATNPEVIEGSLKTNIPLPVVIEYQLLNTTDNCGFFQSYSTIKLFSVVRR